MAIVFDGTTNLLSWAGTIRAALPITMFAWVKRTNTGSDKFTFGTGASGGGVAHIGRGYNLSGYGWYLQSAGYSGTVEQSYVSGETAWHPTMIVVTSADVKIYYGEANSVGVASAHGYSDTLSGHTQFVIGGNPLTSASEFIGEISDVAVWNTALGDTEWATLKAGTAPEGVASGALVEAWALRELGDYTGVNGRTLAVTGTLTRSATDPFVRTAPGATATTLTGPSSGTTGVASTNFTVGANGTITGTVTVTPADGGAGGTFTPTTVAISSGTPTATFTYTPASTGVKTISISDNGGLTDATAISYTSNAAADTTAPTLTSPTGTQTGSTTASGTVSTDEGNGTLYYLASTNATETVGTVKAASSQAVSATGSQGVSFTGLSASTTYYAHYVHTDAASNDSTVSNSASFTTAAGGSTYAPNINKPRPGMGVNFYGAR